MITIYEPSGAAREYAELALNIYRGCTHRCRYCYVPNILRMPRDEFHAGVAVRPGLLRDLQTEAQKYQGCQKAIHLCFTCDPFPNPALFADDAADPTLEALYILADNNLRVRTLTKAPLRAEPCLDTLIACHADFGVSLSWLDDEKRAQVEPGSNGETGLSVIERIEGLEMAKAAGLRTWASVEPVVDPAEALGAIEFLTSIVDEIKVGRLNHSAEANAVDWQPFAREADRILRLWGKPYMLKKGLSELV